MSLRYGLLGLLNHWEASGYDIKQEFDGYVSVFWHSNLSQIYPELQKLEGAGLITSRLVEQTGKPDKKLYTITNLGRQSLIKWLNTPQKLPKQKDAFLMKSFFMGAITADEAIFQLQTFVQQQRQHIENMYAFLQESLKSFREKKVVNRRNLMGAAVYSHSIKQEQLYLNWCEDTIHLITNARFLWDAPNEMSYDEFEKHLLTIFSEEDLQAIIKTN